MEPIAKSIKDSKEAQSTEEVMREIEDTNSYLYNTADDVVVGSMDVVALYPSIDQELGAKLVAEELI